MENDGGAFAALLTDLSKAFDYLSHKLHAYGFDKRSLVLIYNYLSNSKQRVKVNDHTVLGVKSYLEFHKDPY